MITFLMIITTVLLGIVVHSGISYTKKDIQELDENDPGWLNWMTIYDLTGFSYLYGTICHAKAFDLVVIVMKYVPLTIYAYKFAKSYYSRARERIMQIKYEIADIELQLKIINTKISVRETEIKERATQLHESAERLRKLRTKVHKIIAVDDSFKKILADSDNYNIKFMDGSPSSPDQACELIKHLCKNMSPNMQQEYTDRMKDDVYCEWGENEPKTTETSVYSSISDEDKRDCQVKIVKVTNVFKVAYLKNYIKQTRLRRAAKHAVLVKKVEAIKKMLEDWHKTLNMVTSIDHSHRNVDAEMYKIPCQCVGGNFKPSFGHMSDSSSEIKETMEFNEDTLNYIMNPQSPYKIQLDCNDDKQKGDYEDLRSLKVLPEETYSQVEMQTRDF